MSININTAQPTLIVSRPSHEAENIVLLTVPHDRTPVAWPAASDMAFTASFCAYVTTVYGPWAESFKVVSRESQFLGGQGHCVSEPFTLDPALFVYVFLGK
jgi:hypothetical protein